MRTLVALAALAFAIPAFADDTFTLASSEVKPGKRLTNQHVYNGFGCTGANVSPELSWTNAPRGTKSFVVTVYDPDAPTGSGWWHWVVYDIPATSTGLAQGAGSGKDSLPTGAVQGRTDYGAPGFGGACPPVGDKPHRYVFTVYALKVAKLEVPPDASPALIGFMTRANALGSATFTALYGREK